MELCDMGSLRQLLDTNLFMSQGMRLLSTAQTIGSLTQTDGEDNFHKLDINGVERFIDPSGTEKDASKVANSHQRRQEQEQEQERGSPGAMALPSELWVTVPAAPAPASAPAPAPQALQALHTLQAPVSPSAQTGCRVTCDPPPAPQQQQQQQHVQQHPPKPQLHQRRTSELSAQLSSTGGLLPRAPRGSPLRQVSTSRDATADVAASTADVAVATANSYIHAISHPCHPSSAKFMPTSAPVAKSLPLSGPCASRRPPRATSSATPLLPAAHMATSQLSMQTPLCPSVPLSPLYGSGRGVEKDLLAMLHTAVDIARGMVHLHRSNIVHSVSEGVVRKFRSVTAAWGHLHCSWHSVSEVVV